MANAENLKPVRSKREARERGRKGGIASGRTRRERRDMRDTFKALLDMPLKTGGMTSFGSLSSADGKNMTTGEAIAMTMLKKAIDGDVRAAEFVRDTSGQKPSASVEVSTSSREAAESFTGLLNSMRVEAKDGD